MLTAFLVFGILGFIFWWLSKVFKKLSGNLREAAAEESYYKRQVLESVQGIRDSVRPEEAEVLDVRSELRKINSELRAREDQRVQDREAISKLINESDQS